MPSIPGCTEHQWKLSSVLCEAQSKHKAPAVCWLDIDNAILQALYSGLETTVISERWKTPLVFLQKGVYQGDPLSVVILNTVMNTLVDTITRVDLGYQFSDFSD